MPDFIPRLDGIGKIPLLCFCGTAQLPIHPRPRAAHGTDGVLNNNQDSSSLVPSRVHFTSWVQSLLAGLVYLGVGEYIQNPASMLEEEIHSFEMDA